MGFHVDVAELIKLRDAYLESAEKVEGELDTAKNGMNGIITSNSMYGEVGKAINNEINNSHNPIIVGLKNSYTLMGVDFQKTLSDFQSTVGENSESAILDEEVLTQTKTKMTNADTKHTEYETKIGKIYSDINDLISLSCPSSSVSSSITSANKILQDAINNVNKFDTADAPLQTDNIVTALGKQIEVGNQAQALSYTDPRFVDFAAFSQLGDGIQQLDTKITEAKEQAKKEAEEAAKKAKEEWEKNHPVTAWLKNTSEGIGNWWNGVKQGTKDLDIPVLREVLLFGEGVLGAAGSLVSSVAIMASELNDLMNSLTFVAIEAISGEDIAPKWMEDDVNGAWETVKGAGDYAVRFATDEKTRAEAWEGVKNGAVKMWDDFWSDPWYNAGGVAFEVASWFIGVGEVKAGLTAAKGAETFLQGIRAFGSTVGKAALHNADDMARSIGRLATKGDDAMRGAARGMMNLIDDPAATMARWGDNVWDAAGKFGDNMAERFPTFDKLRQRLMSSGDELATATAHYGDDFAEHGARVYNVGNETAEGFAKSGAGRTAASEFTQETSEQLAKHGDDVARHGDDLARELDSAEAGERLAQEAEDYLKTHDMAVRENLSIKPELEEAFARQAENAANLERELVGAGARASAESGQAFAQHGDDVARGLEAASGGAASRVSREFSSQASESLAKHGDDVSRGLRHTGGGGRAGSEFASEAGEEFARHGDDVAKGLEETGEQVGKKARQEFSEEASEQLAEHSDDVAKGLEETGKGLNKPEIPETEPRFGERKISQEEYKALRSETPTDEIRDMVNDGVTLPMNDPVIPGNEITKRLEADHIVSMDRITRMDGFEKLTIEQQLEVLNYEDNFVGLSKSANASKGAKTYEDWTLYKKTGVPIDSAFRAEMMMKEKKLERLLQGMIDNFVKYNGG